MKLELKVHQPQDQVSAETNKVIPPKENEANSRYVSDIEKAGPFSSLYFTYVWRLIKKGYQANKQNKMISSKDLITFPWNRRADILSAKFTNKLEGQKRKNPQKKINLSWAILSTIKWPILKVIVIETLFVFVRIFSAWIVKKLIDCYVDPNTPSDEPWKWAGILSACLVVAFHLEHHFNH